ncbi:glycosyltransferase family 4 protein [Leptolyngbya sp. ST-U4]|uniref:glycosyltransferase family 4 protein n=1 Tax=Leptolyngbya sp. ST-U4 TaxID=2933912 RepID=UPI003298595E
MSIKIAYVAHYEVDNLGAGNGTDYFKLESLRHSEFEIIPVYPLKIEADFSTKLRRKFNEKILKKWHPLDLDASVLKSYAKQLERNPLVQTADAIVCPTFHTVCFLKIDKPIIYWTDATFNNLLDLYPDYKKISSYCVRSGHLAQQKALNNARFAVYSSLWAAKSAANDYGAQLENLRVIPFGINFQSNRTHQEIKEIIDERTRQECKLFFLGFDSERKGVDVAIEVTKRLKDLGVPAHLTIAGSSPKIPKDATEFVTVLGRVNKLKGGSDLLERLFKQSHFFILPSRADCTPMVIAEAFSFGCPALSTSVGGIPSMIENDINGYHLPVGYSPDTYAEKILTLWKNFNRYHQMCLNSFKSFQTTFNWEVAGSNMRSLIKEVVHESQELKRP